MSECIATQKYPVGAKVMAQLRDTVWTVMSYDPRTDFYIVEGMIHGVWHAHRAFRTDELWSPLIVDQINDCAEY